LVQIYNSREEVLFDFLLINFAVIVIDFQQNSGNGIMYAEISHLI